MPPHSDLVQESRLETSFSLNSTRHIFYERGTSGRDRRVRLKERWKRQKRLGQGAYGTVWLEKCDRPARPNGPTVRAVKEIPFDSTTADDIDYHLELEAVMKFSQQRYLPSFVQSFGWFDTPEAIFITMEYVPNGDLQKYLANPIPEDEAKVIACQLAEGLRHMHHNGFTHRDLKPGNILVVLEGPQWLVQISDFGISKRLRPDMAQQTLGTMRRGTMGFIAPEMLGFVLERDYPHAVDIWSLGAVVFRMLTKEVFLPDLTQLQKYAAKEHPFPDHRLEALKVTMSLRELLRRLLAPSPKDRPSASEILEDAWLKDISVSLRDHDEDSQHEDDTSSGAADSECCTSDGDIPSAAWSTGVEPARAGMQPQKVDQTAQLTTLKGPLEGSPEEISKGLTCAAKPSSEAKEENSRDTTDEEKGAKVSDQPESPPITARFLIDARGTAHFANLPPSKARDRESATLPADMIKSLKITRQASPPNSNGPRKTKRTRRVLRREASEPSPSSEDQPRGEAPFHPRPHRRSSGVRIRQNSSTWANATSKAESSEEELEEEPEEELAVYSSAQIEPEEDPSSVWHCHSEDDCYHHTLRGGEIWRFLRTQGREKDLYPTGDPIIRAKHERVPKFLGMILDPSLMSASLMHWAEPFRKENLPILESTNLLAELLDGLHFAVLDGRTHYASRLEIYGIYSEFDSADTLRREFCTIFEMCEERLPETAGKKVFWSLTEETCQAIPRLLFGEDGLLNLTQAFMRRLQAFLRQHRAYCVRMPDNLDRQSLVVESGEPSYSKPLAQGHLRLVSQNLFPTEWSSRPARPRPSMGPKTDPQGPPRSRPQTPNEDSAPEDYHRGFSASRPRGRREPRVTTRYYSHPDFDPLRRWQIYSRSTRELPFRESGRPGEPTSVGGGNNALPSEGFTEFMSGALRD